MSTKDRLALTESCRDRNDLLGILQRGDEDALGDHLRRCAACRKLVADAVRGLLAAGESPGPPAALKTLAGRLLGRDDGEDPVVTVVAGGDQVIEVANAEGGPVGRGGAYHLDVAHDLGTFRIAVDVVAGGVFVLRLRAAPCGEKGAAPTVVLRRAAGEPWAPARKLTEPLSWTGLPPGRYILVAAGTQGRAAVALHLVYRRDDD